MTTKETDIYGLVLAGGKSKRMGEDKGLIKWHEQPQRYYVADLLDKHCDKVFISCREDQADEIKAEGYNTIIDKFDEDGPAAAIMSAFSDYPSHAWMVIACDLPLVNDDTIQYLIDNRDIEKVATTYKSPHDGLPEPLITLWEPKAFDVLLSFQKDGYKCPRKALINSDTKILDPANPKALMNANTPEDAKEVRAIINKENN